MRIKIWKKIYLNIFQRYNIELKDLFGKTVCVIMDGATTMSIEQLKEKAQFLTGVKSKLIKLMDKKESVELDNKIEITFENGKWYVKSNKNLNEIDLYLSYIYAWMTRLIIIIIILFKNVKNRNNIYPI